MPLRRLSALNFRNIKVNRVIRLLTYSDILLLSGWGLINPILAVFFADQIEGGDVKVAGIAVMVFFLVKSLLQIPLARVIDLKKGELDDYWWMLAGTILIAVAPFLFLWATLPWHVYLIQVVHGIGGALSYPTWLAIFTRHIDKHEEGLEWSIYYTTTDMGAAITAGAGGYMASLFGYDLVFLVVGIASVIGTLFLLGVKQYMRKTS
jgi:DHA1 family quinolone resistance protein-like MFS transporter